MRVPAIIAATAFLAAPGHAQSVVRGKEVFQNCTTCHQIGADAQNAIGPVLTGVVGRRAGSYQGYAYSDALERAGAQGLVWDEESLFAWLADPSEFLQAHLDDPEAGAKMPFALADEADRRAVIAYLETTEMSAAPPPDDEVKDPTLGLAAGEDELCVANASQSTHFFAAESGSGTRRTGNLAPGEALCVPSETGGMVSAFMDEEAFEGCSRLVEPGQMERLFRYLSFDRCFWASNSG